jgi:hypothetical protein
MEWDVTGIHAAVFRTGEALNFAYPFAGPGSEAWTIDPGTGATTSVIAPGNFFCGGQAFVPDGDLIVFGGTDERSTNDEFYGLPDVTRFDPDDRSWTRLPDMSHGRWYPTATALPDGRILVSAGLDTDGEPTPVLEVFGPGDETVALPNADRYQPLYPRMFLLPSGEVLDAGPADVSMALDLDTGEWREVAESAYGWRDSGTSVLLPLSAPDYTPRIFTTGGDDPATNTAELLDLGNDMPAWEPLPSMAYERRHANSTILPDGTVLVSGGTAVDNEPDDAALPAEIFDPETRTWSEVASLHEPRLYHSTAILLPDGRVMTSGGDGELSAEFYSPPYLFRGPRPEITSAAATTRYDASFTVMSPDADDITGAVLIRPGAVTHSFNQEQRMIDLEFTAGGGRLAIESPPDPNLAPPGYYMLFLLNADGVPSEAAFIRLGDDQPDDVHGDATCDGAVDADDALATMSFLAGRQALQGGGCTAIGTGTPVFGDANCDGVVDARDAIALLEHMAALPEDTRPGCEPIGR